MNKRGEIGVGFFILVVIGLVVVTALFRIWSGQDFNPGLTTKIGAYVAVPLIAYFFASRE